MRCKTFKIFSFLSFILTSLFRTLFVFLDRYAPHKKDYETAYIEKVKA